MYFRQISEILTGTKTQTRRVCKPGETLADWAVFSDGNIVGGRVKWAVGHTYAVVPKRGLPAVWWSEKDGGAVWRTAAYDLRTIGPGFRPLRIRITAIRHECLQDISEADAQAEGVGSVAEYRALWDSINGKTKGARWSENPTVWVLTFEMVKEKGEQS